MQSEIKRSQELVARKYSDIYKKYESEKLSTIQSEKPISGFRELKPDNFAICGCDEIDGDT